MTDLKFVTSEAFLSAKAVALFIASSEKYFFAVFRYSIVFRTKKISANIAEKEEARKISSSGLYNMI